MSFFPSEHRNRPTACEVQNRPPEKEGTVFLLSLRHEVRPSVSRARRRRERGRGAGRWSAKLWKRKRRRTPRRRTRRRTANWRLRGPRPRFVRLLSSVLFFETFCIFLPPHTACHDRRGGAFRFWEVVVSDPTPTATLTLGPKLTALKRILFLPPSGFIPNFRVSEFDPWGRLVFPGPPEPPSPGRGGWTGGLVGGARPPSLGTKKPLVAA